jgi:hypothetical protein
MMRRDVSSGELASPVAGDFPGKAGSLAVTTAGVGSASDRRRARVNYHVTARFLALTSLGNEEAWKDRMVRAAGIPAELG